MAIRTMVRTCPGMLALAGRLLVARVGLIVVRPVHWLVARHRHQLPGGTGTCQLPRCPEVPRIGGWRPCLASGVWSACRAQRGRTASRRVTCPLYDDVVLGIAWTAASLGMLSYGVASVLQGVGARRATGASVMVQPLYLVGVGCDLLAWALSVVALQWLPLFSVQAVLAGSLAVTVLLARLFLGATLLRRDVAAVVVTVLALVVVAMASGAEAAVRPSAGFDEALFGGLVLIGVGVAVAYRRHRPEAMAVLAGLAYSGAAIGARALPLDRGVPGLLTSWTLWLLLGFGVLGMLAYARALELGSLGAATALLWVVEIVVPGAVGVGWLGDGVQPGWALPALLAVGAAVAACGVLAFSPAQPE